MGTLYLDSGGAATNSGTSDNNAADLSGTANATVVANKTFVDANVNTGTDQITATAHGYTSGSGVELTTTGVLPAGLTLLTLYYLFVVDANTLTLHTNVADALAGTNPVNITAAAGGGTHTINNMTVALGGAPDLSAVKASHCRLTTTGTSHVFSMAGGIHGLVTGEMVWLELSASGTFPVGIVEGTGYFVNALSATTFRLYTTKALADAGGASSLNVSAVEVRTLTVRGALQSSIALASSTNSFRKVFWVRGVDNTNKQLILAATVTGLGAGSDWAIGGRVSASGILNLVQAIRNGDTIIQNTDLSVTVEVFWSNHEGESFGPTKWIGKAGARRLYASTVSCLSSWAPVCGLFQNMEFQSAGSGGAGNIFINGSGRTVWDNCRFTDGVDPGAANQRNGYYIECEFSGLERWGGNTNCVTVLYRCYSHEMTSFDTLSNSGGETLIAVQSIFERATTRGLVINPGLVAALLGCTFYRSGASGVELFSAPTLGNIIIAMDGIFKDNGNVSTEANLDLKLQLALLIERRNCVNISGGLGGVNTLGVAALDASDITTDPLFVAPDASAGSRNFGLKASSPAKGIPYTYLNSLSVTYHDMGAVQRQERTARAQSLLGI